MESNPEAKKAVNYRGDEFCGGHDCFFCESCLFTLNFTQTVTLDGLN